MNSRKLFEQDEPLWIEKQIALFREDRMEDLDLDLVFQLLLEMTQSDKRSAVGLARVILVHLLKLKYQPEMRSQSWIRSILSSRATLNDLLTKSLKTHLRSEMPTIYKQAVRWAAKETGLPISRFPKTNPISFDQLLDADYFAGRL